LSPVCDRPRDEFSNAAGVLAKLARACHGLAGKADQDDPKRDMRPQEVLASRRHFSKHQLDQSSHRKPEQEKPKLPAVSHAAKHGDGGSTGEECRADG